LAQDIKTWGGNITSSISINNNSNLWEVLSYNLSPDHWRSAINQNGIIISTHVKIEETKKKFIYKHIITTGYNGNIFINNNGDNNNNNNNNLTNSIASSNYFSLFYLLNKVPIFTKEFLDKMTIIDLKDICKKYNIKQGCYFIKIID
jgi:hypothetical protein